MIRDRTSQMRDRTRQITFETDPDVKKMVDAIRDAGLKLKPILNQALRLYLPKRPTIQPQNRNR